jgi:predicted flap endonuclease-1-like 5' DNA nuclease
VEAPAAQPPAAAASAPAASDDFGRIFGIDAASATVLRSAGIHTYQELAAADVRNLRQILADAGQSSTDPTTWPQQARFAAGDKWKQLEKMQSRFKGERTA